MNAKEKIKIVAIMIFVAVFVGISIAWQEIRHTNGKILHNTPPTVQEAMEKQQITVNVAGAVLNPGLYLLPPDSRAAAAVEKAGGFLPEADKDKFNSARRCYDGIHIQVPFKKTSTKKSTTKSTTSKKNYTAPKSKNEGAVININIASEEELMTLPGIGPVLAKKIVDYRKENGNFKVVEQLLDVSGIGLSKFEQLKERVKI